MNTVIVLHKTKKKKLKPKIRVCVSNSSLFSLKFQYFQDVDKILTESDKPQTNAEQINPTSNENDSIEVANEKESIDVANANENANENPNETVTKDQSTTAISEASTNATECAAAT